jgi:uncharacterized protein (DUF362 family)
MDDIFSRAESYLRNRIPLTRNTFLKFCLLGTAAALSGSTMAKNAFAAQASVKPRPKRTIKSDCDLAVVSGADPYKNTVLAVEKLGGMGLFVKKGATVVVKPNIGWDRNPEQAANTNPQVVAALVDMCMKAGARRVNVFDVTCNDAKACYENSGILKAAKERGAKVWYPEDRDAVLARFPYKSSMEGWPLVKEAVQCDTFINVPVLKDHGLTRLSLCMKNLMGVCTSKRGQMHWNIGPKLVDLTDFIGAELNVIDATRALMRHGPTGGRLEDVTKMDKVLASPDPSLVDTYACSLMKVDPMDVPYLKVARERGFGQTYPDKAKIVHAKG